jgi:hypothetical protein
MRFALAASALCVLAALLAGCSSTSTAPQASTSTTITVPPPSAGSYGVMAMDTPQSVSPGANFTVLVHVESIDGQTRMSNHIGAHFGPTSTDAPSTTVYTSACVHTTGNLPGMYNVTCKAPATAGTIYLRGHARIVKADGTNQDWWSDEVQIQVA